MGVFPKTICKKGKNIHTMEVEVAKLSKKGQIVIPSQVREEAHLEESDEFLVFGKDDMVILKKIDKEALEKTFDEIVGPLREKAEELDLQKDDVEDIIHEYRDEKAKSGT